MKLSGKNVFITGTNRGIGRAMVEAFARNGAGIWAHARQETPEFLAFTKEVSEKYGVRVDAVCFDLTDYAAMKSAVMAIRKTGLPIDGLVNNAGITYNALFQMCTESNLRQQFEVNFFSMFMLTQYVSKLMVRTGGGSIVNISSSAAFDGNPGKSVYGATKAAVYAMTHSIASELGVNGIRANCIAPGITETDMLATMPHDVVEAARASADLRRGARPDEIAETAVFLVSDDAAYITGQVVRVDGGLKR